MKEDDENMTAYIQTGVQKGIIMTYMTYVRKMWSLLCRR